MAYKVDSGIALPPRAGGVEAKYPFADLQVGDSFFVPRNNNTAMVAHKARLAAAVSAARKKYGDRTFASREIDNGVRVWRTA